MTSAATEVVSPGRSSMLVDLTTRPIMIRAATQRSPAETSQPPKVSVNWAVTVPNSVIRANVRIPATWGRGPLAL